MSDDARRGEDVAGLFRKFGGDAKGYREFAPEPQMHEPAPAWRLVSGARQGAAANSPAAAPVAAAAVVPEPVQAPVAAPAVPVAAAPKSLFLRPAAGAAAAPLRAATPQPAAAPAPQVQKPAPLAGLAVSPMASAPEPAVAAPAPAVRELDSLFARLNGEPPPQAPEPRGAGLLSRWRRPS